MSSFSRTKKCEQIFARWDSWFNDGWSISVYTPFYVPSPQDALPDSPLLHLRDGVLRGVAPEGTQAIKSVHFDGR